MTGIESIECPIPPLKYSTVDEHCHTLRELKSIPYWWYQGRSKLFGNYSMPFKDRNDSWWYQVKPGLCWPVDILEPMQNAQPIIPLTKSFFGYQCLVVDDSGADSRLTINVIRDIKEYGAGSISSKRRNSVRKGLQCCDLEALVQPDPATFNECRLAWDELSHRTGWKSVAEVKEFNRTWSALLDCPGVSIIVGRDAKSGRVAGFLITKIIGSTAYVDTIASRDDSLHLNINDALMYSFVFSASKIPNIEKAHYAIKSNVDSLERFKTGMGFIPFPYPARTTLRGPTGFILKSFFGTKYLRMTGRSE